MADAVVLDGSAVGLEAFEAVARAGGRVSMADEALARVRASRAVVEASLKDGQPQYGINTGFGSLSMQQVGMGQLGELQTNLIRSHAAGIGPPLPKEIVRGMMLLLVASLCRGCSGVRPVLIERLVAMLNAGVTPTVPEIGSVGASGDLAPLAHLALVLLGEGEAEIGGKRMPGAQALQSAGIEPLQLVAKEGLALINGTHLMAARGALLCVDFDRLMDAALLGAAMSLDACRGTARPFDARVYNVRNQPGPRTAAARLRELLVGSEIVVSHQEDDPRVQDPYSLRCAAMVLGAAMDAASYVKQAVQNELGAVTDNPLVFADSEAKAGADSGADRGAHADAIVAAGNFHGMPIAIPLDVMAIALSHVAGISERRTFFMLSARDPETHLPPYLSPNPGLHSGLMIAQYTAAACCNEIIALASPASVVNISTSAGIEDYNSFGPRSAAKATRALQLSRNVVAIELMCAAEAIERHRPLRSGAMVEEAHALIRRCVEPYAADRSPAADIAAIPTTAMRGTDGVDTATMRGTDNVVLAGPTKNEMDAGHAALPTAVENADQTWDEAKAGHTAGGSFGEEMQAHALSTEITALNDLSLVDILDSASEIDGLTLREVFAVLAAGIAGQISGASTTTVTIKDHSGTATP
ncbi:MAG: histidine ammonia-lyase, partial [Planctomycetes bacterium]|nr:histidine ammonia-lyase [Planctomycetota bacterium]